MDAIFINVNMQSLCDRKDLDRMLENEHNPSFLACVSDCVLMLRHTIMCIRIAGDVQYY